MRLWSFYETTSSFALLKEYKQQELFWAEGLVALCWQGAREQEKPSSTDIMRYLDTELSKYLMIYLNMIYQISSDPFFLLFLFLSESQTTTIPSFSCSLTSRWVWQDRCKIGGWVKENIQGIFSPLSLLYMLSLAVAVSPLCFYQRTTLSMILVSARKTYHSYSLI